MLDWGPLSQSMLVHIVLMAVLAPALAWELRERVPAALARTLPYATAIQALLLWAWHLPAAAELAFTRAPLMAMMHVTLALTALWFWLAVFAVRRTARWRAVLSCLVSGKLFCLLGALLIFAPPTLYAGITASGGICGTGPITAGDQGLAGAMMLVACPLTYVAAAIVITARWFKALEPNAARA